MKKSPFRPFTGPKAMQAQAMRPPSVAIDRMQRMIEVGHLVMFHNEEDLIFEVVDIRPVLDPNIPQGQGVVTVMLSAQFPVHTHAAMPNRGMIIVGESPARIAKQASENGNRPEESVRVASASGLVLTDAPSDPVQEPVDDTPDEPIED